MATSSNKVSSISDKRRKATFAQHYTLITPIKFIKESIKKLKLITDIPSFKLIQIICIVHIRLYLIWSKSSNSHNRLNLVNYLKKLCTSQRRRGWWGFCRSVNISIWRFLSHHWDLSSKFWYPNKKKRKKKT